MIPPGIDINDAALHQHLNIGVRTREGTTIRALPPDVIASIKSSTAITSLEHVAFELLKNSLDSNASKVEITIDFRRGSCTIEDNGTGVEPREFADGGGIGKIYNTSRYHSKGECYGRHGTFLASVGALSHLTIISRHRLHQSLNSITIHRSKVLTRLRPAPAHQEILFRNHGTKVSVVDLFGAMPVRVKQRAAIGSYAKLWDSLKRDLLSLLLAWQSSVSVRVYDENGLTRTVLTTRINDATRSRDRLEGVRFSAFKAESVPSLLSQASYVDSADWKRWIPVNAVSTEMIIEGSISLDPMPNKLLQFVSFGINPVQHHDGHNELFDEINRLFSNSTFGVNEDSFSPVEEVKTRGSRPFFAQGNAAAESPTTLRKGVDRWPMFYLRITFRTRTDTAALDDLVSESRNTFNSVTKMLQTTITQWLIAHGFKHRRHRSNEDAILSGQHRHISEDTAAVKRIESGTQLKVHTRPASKTPCETLSQNAFISAETPSGENNKPHTERTFRSFGDWSRIKSGDPKFYEAAWTKRPISSDSALHNRKTDVKPAPSNFQVVDVLQGSLNLEPSCINAHETNDNPLSSESCRPDKANDDTTAPWVDPVTKTTTLISTRTGCVTPSSASSARSHSKQSSGLFAKVSKLTGPKDGERDAVPSPWLSELLASWSNPVFHAAEMAIPHVPVETLLQLDREVASKCCHSGATLDAAADRITKHGLATAEVIAQVDRKFILVKAGSRHQNTRTEGSSSTVLILIDQHAADERCRVEELLEALFLPPEDSESTRSNLGYKSHIKTTLLVQHIRFELPANEAEILGNNAANLAAWGIIYDLERKTSAQPGSSRARWIVIVKYLPPSIVERCRLDPKILLSFLRTESWKFAETVRYQPSTEFKPGSKSSWISRLSSVPTGMLDMINSRACRSAIMFNDVLDHQQCVELVQKLAKCAFPFQCAHGRPSMVPLVDIGSEGSRNNDGSSLSGFGNTEAEQQSFKNAFQVWRRTD